MNAAIAQRLAEGDPVVLFGEGTAGDGNRVLPFRTALIGAARDAIAAAGDGQQIWIQPLSIAYVEPAGHPARTPSAPARRLVRQDEPLSAHRRDRAHGAVDVAVTWGEPVAYDGETDRKALARDLEAAIRGDTDRGAARKAARRGPGA